jgi:hypothetical protein
LTAQQLHQPSPERSEVWKALEVNYRRPRNEQIQHKRTADIETAMLIGKYLVNPNTQQKGIQTSIPWRFSHSMTAIQNDPPDCEDSICRTIPSGRNFWFSIRSSTLDQTLKT